MPTQEESLLLSLSYDSSMLLEITR
jgi:hypothetical protein